MLWKSLSVFFKDELVQVVASPKDYHKPSSEEVAERDISLLKLVPPQALVYPTESNPLRIFVSRSWLPQSRKGGERVFISGQFSYSDWYLKLRASVSNPSWCRPW